jgi:hypothetical protein
MNASLPYPNYFKLEGCPLSANTSMLMSSAYKTIFVPWGVYHVIEIQEKTGDNSFQNDMKFK